MISYSFYSVHISFLLFGSYLLFIITNEWDDCLQSISTSSSMSFSTWVLDSSVSHHMPPDFLSFASLSPMSSSLSLFVGYESKLCLSLFVGMNPNFAYFYLLDMNPNFICLYLLDMNPNFVWLYLLDMNSNFVSLFFFFYFSFLSGFMSSFVSFPFSLSPPPTTTPRSCS